MLKLFTQIKCKKQEYKYIGTEITENIKIHNNSSNLTEINNNKVELNGDNLGYLADY